DCVAEYGSADAKMIPMRSEDYGLRLKRGVAAFCNADYVVADDFLDASGDIPLQVYAKCVRFEAFRIGLFHGPIHAATGHSQQFLARLTRQPAGEGECRLSRLPLELRAVERPDHGIWIPCRLSRMDDEACLRAAPGSLLELVCPTTVVGECGTA